MIEDRAIGGKSYRVILDTTVRNPVSKVAVFMGPEGKRIKIDGSEKTAQPNQSDVELIKEAWEFAKHHARSSGSSRT
jgi:hypothetical protein